MTCRTSPGTTVTVTDVFWNLPVRQRLLQDNPESAAEQVKRRVERCAVANPDVSFRLVNDDQSRTVLVARRATSAVGTVLQLYGSHVADSLCGVSHSTAHYQLSGYLSAPAEGFPTKEFQFLCTLVLSLPFPSLARLFFPARVAALCGGGGEGACNSRQADAVVLTGPPPHPLHRRQRARGGPWQ